MYQCKCGVYHDGRGRQSKEAGCGGVWGQRECFECYEKRWDAIDAKREADEKAFEASPEGAERRRWLTSPEYAAVAAADALLDEDEDEDEDEADEE